MKNSTNDLWHLKPILLKDLFIKFHKNISIKIILDKIKF